MATVDAPDIEYTSVQGGTRRPKHHLRTNIKKVLAVAAVCSALLVLIVVVANGGGSSDTSVPEGVSLPPDDGVVSFHTAGRIPEGSFVDTLDTTVKTVFGGLETVTTEISSKNERTVESLPQGGFAVDGEMISMKMSMKDTLGVIDVECDTGSELKDDPILKQICEPIYVMIGTKIHFVLDEEGNIAEASGPGAEIFNSMMDGNQQNQNSVSPSSTIEQTARILKLLPHHPVKVGDQWPEATDLEDLGRIEGISSFVGYHECDGAHCAIIKTFGNLEMDMEKLIEKMGGAIAGAASIKSAKGTLDATLYWDDQNQLVHWSQTTMSLTMVVDDPIMGTIEVPVDEIITLTTVPKE